MKRDLKLINNAENFTFLNFDLILIDDLFEAIRQKLNFKLRMYLGEWYLNITEGLPYFSDIFVKNPNLIYVQDLIKTKIMEVEEIKRLTSFTLEIDKANRKLLVDFTADTIDGDSITLQIGA